MHRQSRIIRLEAAHDRTVRLLSGLHVSLEDGAAKSWVTVTRTGNFRDPRYGEFAITRELLLSMVANFDAKTYGQDIFIDVAHKPENGAAGKIVRLAVEGDRLRALVEWTPLGVDAVKAKGFTYLSAEYHENFRDNESGNAHGCVLLGAGLVTRPCIKRLDPVQLSEADAAPEGVAILLHPTLLSELLTEVKTTMDKYLKQLEASLRARKLSEATITAYLDAAKKALSGMSDDAQMKALTESLEATIVTLSESTAPPVIHIAGGGLTAADVTRILAENAAAQADAAKKLAETLDGHKKLLAETINAAAGLDADTKAKLLADASELITPDMSADQVKRFAAHQVVMGNQIAAARQLSALGFVPAGSVHISVDSSNEVKALQEQADRRLGYAGMADAERYRNTGGVLQAKNKKLAEAVLAIYDTQNGARLHAEHRLLAAGDGLVSDVAVPATFERTVLRETLYGLIGLQFVDVGTAAFSGTHDLPYSYRDTTAAGINSVSVYEGGSIPRSGVKQATETAYILPQKLAFEVSDELRYLTANGQLVNWDAVAENARNAVRIVGEDTERKIFNEILNASDQYAVTAVVNEATGTGNGSKSIFPLGNFPAVRPKVLKNLQGTQVGSTLYPVVVKSNAVTITEWDGTGTQSAGLYFWMDYNLGEVHFVDKDGAPSNITNTHLVVTSYSYTTNVYKFDTDQGSVATDLFWNTFLYRYGLRKSVIEDQRYYSANFGLMSGTVMTTIEQAQAFIESGARNGTNLTELGNLGTIKGVPNFKAFAPGLAMGDQRIVIGERNQTRYRMAKPWTMGQLQDQKDANGRFTGKKEAYGDQFVFLHTPTQLKAATTSIALFSTSTRVAR